MSRGKERRLYFERKAAGLCVRCGAANDGTVHCAFHHEEYTAHVQHHRTRRSLGPRSVTIAGKRLTREEKEAAARLEYIDDPDRPRTRGDCQGGERPCPYVSCRHHLFLDVNPETGSLKLNYPDREPWEVDESCALDLADQGGMTLEEVGAVLGLVRERIRQVEVAALHQLHRAGIDLGDGPVRRRRA